MRTIFGEQGFASLNGFAETGWGLLQPTEPEEERTEGYADTGWGLLKRSATSAIRRPQYATALSGLRQARINSPSLGLFDFDLPSLPDFPPVPSPAPAPPPAVPPAAPPAEPTPRVELEPLYAYPVGVEVACPAGDGTFTILNAQTGAVLRTGVPAVPAGMTILAPGDPRCAAMVRAPSAAEPAKEPAREGVSTTTIVFAVAASALAAGVIVLLAQK